ncbi:hypothetical protein [Paraburkholderia monticola]|uniref:hypothetical protein n=1 Tax=Paraburkholderia monticola TaxID=1399968 RepID=UPI00137B0166|nr:hypothetical protein [Paraburkholderia monticola]
MPLIVQVCAVMLPLKVIVLSAANAADTMPIAATTPAHASECAVFILFPVNCNIELKMV